jgi:hypothetical protein
MEADMRVLVAGAVGLVVVLAAASGPSAADSTECKCRAPTGMFGLGEETCLQTSDGPRKATCVMMLNNTSWRIDERACGISRRGGGPVPA